MLLLPHKNMFSKNFIQKMTIKKACLILLAGYISVVFTSCKKWENHDAVNDAQLSKTLMAQISQDVTLSVFSSYLVKTGYDKVIASSKTFTVWAPDNTAMQAVDPSILNDSTRLKQFVGNHIANQSYATTEPLGSMRVKILNGKNVTFTRTSFEEANITRANQYVGNGILHVIDKAILPKLSIWEFLNSNLNTAGIKQKNYIQALNYSYTDTSKATQTGVDPVTGKPVLKAGTGVISANTYLNTVLDISNENQQYTYIILADAAYDNERNKVVRFFNTTGNYGTTGLDSTTYLSGFNVVKDLAINKLLLPAQIMANDVLTSVNNVNVPFNKSNVLQTYVASNGIVYVMSSVNFRLQDKITPIYIQGENPVSFSRTDKNANIQYRIRKDPSGNTFNDILIAGSGAGSLPAQFFAQYAAKNLYSAQYKVYWRAINDTGVAFSQQLSFNTSIAATFPYQVVGPNVFGDVLLSNTNYTVTKYGTQNMYMLGNTNTTNGTNSITFDYVKLDPVLQ
ncbi:MAG: fasciclin domain-containing protein [Sphingobacteriaceae bacterium]|nr:MAG: fasciclin domain-containing protein [Sphingobacteriaceae bacterium]